MGPIAGLLEIQVNQDRKTIERWRVNGGWYAKSKKDWKTLFEDGDMQFYGPRNFVLTHGRYWKPQPLPEGYRLGTLGRCGRNACRLALGHPGLTYVEGYAIPGLETYLGDMEGHSWVVDDEGRVIDNTWPELGMAYYGVPFKTAYLRKVCGSRFKSTLLDDWRNGFPLLRKGLSVATWKETKFTGLP